MYKCQICGKPATYFLQTNINGNVQSTHLCAECAQKQEFNVKVPQIDDFQNFFSPFFFGIPSSYTEVKRCPQCGMSFTEICDTSKFGCASCYKTFREQSESSLKKLHGALLHKGKKPKSVLQKPENELEDLKTQLEKAVSCEDYEKAAELRDKIRLINPKKEGE